MVPLSYQRTRIYLNNLGPLISTMLQDEFHLSPLWSSVPPVQEGVASGGRRLLNMLPVDKIDHFIRMPAHVELLQIKLQQPPLPHAAAAAAAAATCCRDSEADYDKYDGHIFISAA